jgi:hypothetical protein
MGKKKKKKKKGPLQITKHWGLGLLPKNGGGTQFIP